MKNRLRCDLELCRRLDGRRRAIRAEKRKNGARGVPYPAQPTTRTAQCGSWTSSYMHANRRCSWRWTG